MENEKFLSEQILTYLGNKRALLDFIGEGVEFVKKELKKEKLFCADLFSGSGIVARFLKANSEFLIANDLETYSKITNECYLSNISADLLSEISKIRTEILNEVYENLTPGFITELYAPKNDKNIMPEERVFYTHKNAVFIDSARREISKISPEMQKFFIAPLLYEASTHANTSGVFKGFYKNKKGIGQFGGEGRNALKRILGDISLSLPVFSNFSVPFSVEQKDANKLAGELENCDICYLDPPYNQHPYGSNYFMLNLIAKYERPNEISQVSGIAQGWNKSVYNKKTRAAEAFFDLISKLKAKFVLISFNNEGFIDKSEFIKNLEKFGKLNILEKKDNRFRGSRNLNNRKIYVTEILYILKKN